MGPVLLILTLIAAVCSSAVMGSDDATNNNTLLLRSLCGTTRALDPQSFDVNFVDAMEMISRQIADSGFGIAVSGENGDDRVYGLGQCLNYLSNTNCRLCYAESRVKIPLCLPATSARVYLNGCFLRYGNYNFSEEVVSDLDSSVCDSTKNVTNSSTFSEITNGLIQNLTSKAYDQRDYYMEGNVAVSSGIRVYGIAQCWKSLNRTGCRTCLENAGKRIGDCLPASGGKTLNVGCLVRYSVEPFTEQFLQKNSDSSAVIGRVLGIVFGSILAALVVIGGAIFWRRRGYSNPDEITCDNGSSEIFKLISESHLSFKYDELRKSTDGFSMENKIGQGGYGTVYKGILPDGREIAVKRLFLNTTQWLDQFFNEVNLISQVQHKNLVKLLGCSVDGPESLLVYEYLYNTSLDRFLFDSFRKKALDWGRRVDILVGTAEGLAYLHEASEVRIIHRDIKASNILLDEKFKPKIADFGLARYFAEGQSHLSTGVAGTLGYMAPEYVVHGQLTEKADVYSYGVFVLEVVTGRKNTTSISLSTEGHTLLQQIWEHFNSDTIIELVDKDLKGRFEEEEVVKVFQVGLLCTQAAPSLRPPMWKVVEMLMSKTSELPTPNQPPFINIKGVKSASSSSQGSSYTKFGSSSNKSPLSVNQLSVSIMAGR